ncbi:MAG: hypothetical protein WEC37_00085 [Anaerolineales bacterium]
MNEGTRFGILALVILIGGIYLACLVQSLVRWRFQTKGRFGSRGDPYPGAVLSDQDG